MQDFIDKPSDWSSNIIHRSPFAFDIRALFTSISISVNEMTWEKIRCYSKVKMAKECFFLDVYIYMRVNFLVKRGGFTKPKLKSIKKSIFSKKPLVMLLGMVLGKILLMNLSTPLDSIH